MFRLSPQQELVWFHRHLAPNSAAYHFITLVEFEGELDAATLEAAIEHCVRHHPGLGLCLVDESLSEPRQDISTDVVIDFLEVDLSACPDPDARAHQELINVTQRPFDLTRAPLARWRLLKFSERRYRLIYVEHHFIHDGRSFSMVLRDIFSAYRSLHEGSVPVTEPSRSYQEYVQYVYSAEARQEIAKNLQWWQDALADAELDSFPFRRLALRTGKRTGFDGAQLRRSVPGELARAVRQQAARCGATQFALMFGLYCEMLRRHDGLTETTVGTALANRPTQFDRMVGMLVTTMPVRLAHQPSWTVRGLAQHAMDAVLTASDHVVPVQDLVRTIGRRSPGLDNPLHRSMFSTHDSRLPDSVMPGVAASFVEGLNLSASRTDVDVVVLSGERAPNGDERDALTIVWDYSTEFFEESAIVLLAERFEGLLEACSLHATPDTRVRDLPLATTHADPH
jgi:hypothetical protein